MVTNIITPKRVCEKRKNAKPVIEREREDQDPPAALILFFRTLLQKKIIAT